MEQDGHLAFKDTVATAESLESRILLTFVSGFDSKYYSISSQAEACQAVTRAILRHVGMVLCMLLLYVSAVCPGRLVKQEMNGSRRHFWKGWFELCRYVLDWRHVRFKRSGQKSGGKDFQNIKCKCTCFHLSILSWFAPFVKISRRSKPTMRAVTDPWTLRNCEKHWRRCVFFKNCHTIWLNCHGMRWLAVLWVLENLAILSGAWNLFRRWSQKDLCRPGQEQGRFFFPFFFRLMLDMEGNGCKHVGNQACTSPENAWQFLQDGEVSYAEFAAWWLGFKQWKKAVPIGVSTMETHTENQR